MDWLCCLLDVVSPDKWTYFVACFTLFLRINGLTLLLLYVVSPDKWTYIVACLTLFFLINGLTLSPALRCFSWTRLHRSWPWCLASGSGSARLVWLRACAMSRASRPEPRQASQKRRASLPEHKSFNFYQHMKGSSINNNKKCKYHRMSGCGFVYGWMRWKALPKTKNPRRYSSHVGLKTESGQITQYFH